MINISKKFRDKLYNIIRLVLRRNEFITLNLNAKFICAICRKEFIMGTHLHLGWTRNEINL